MDTMKLVEHHSRGRAQAIVRTLPYNALSGDMAISALRVRLTTTSRS